MILPENMKPVICITGPTASGKSGAAIRLARDLDGEIINADSMQVYSDLQLLSARPSLSEQGGIPHHLFGHVPGSHRYSAGEWVRDALPVVLDCMAREKTPILVGGTGLYYKSLFEGIANIPVPSLESFAYAKSISEKGIDALRAEAERLDPAAAARVMGADPQRLVRIVTVAKGTAKKLSEWQAETKPFVPKGYWKGVVVVPDRAELYARINARFDRMIYAGALSEVRALAARALDPGLPVMKAIGVPSLMRVITDGLSVANAVEIAKRDTRRYAKRQFTWLRANSQGWKVVAGPNEITAETFD